MSEFEKWHKECRCPEIHYDCTHLVGIVRAFRILIKFARYARGQRNRLNGGPRFPQRIGRRLVKSTKRPIHALQIRTGGKL